MQPMRRESPYPMVPIKQASAIIAAHAKPLGTEVIDCRAADALGRVLAETIYAPADLPDLPKAAVDGYALQAADGLNRRRVLAEVTAGNAQDVTVEPGTAVRIMTGAPVPPGADAVIMVEQTAERDGVVQIERELVSGENIHVIGQDVARGSDILAAGTPLGMAEVGLLATVGQVRVPVYRRPRVGVLSTGDEVYEPDADLPPGGIRDSNRYALLAAVAEAGCEPVSLGIVHDDERTLREQMLAALEQVDVLLTSGGVSMGTRDLIKPLLADIGTVHFGRIAFKPGKPTTFATVQDKIVFGLPGYPVSSLVSFEVFVRPALRRLQGDCRPDRPLVQVALAEGITPAPDRPEYQRVTVRWQHGQLVAYSTGAQGSSRLLSLRGANALLLVPPGDTRYETGASLPALLTGPILEG